MKENENITPEPNYIPSGERWEHEIIEKEKIQSISELYAELFKRKLIANK